MLCAFTIFENTSLRVDEFFLKCGEGFLVLLLIGFCIIGLASGDGKFAHALESAEVEGIDDGVDGSENVAIALGGGPIDNVIALLLFLIADE